VLTKWPWARLGGKMFKKLSRREIAVIIGSALVISVLFAGWLVSRPFLAIHSINNQVTASDQPEWYVIERPVEVIPSVFKFKLVRGLGAGEPVVEAFGVGHKDMAGQKEFPRPLLGEKVELTSSIALPGESPLPVRFIEPIQ